MADFWIKIEKCTPDKPEVFEIAEALGIDPDSVLGKLVRAWAWLDSNSENGHVTSVTNVLIDRITACDGFANAMRRVGWLSEEGVPNFDRHMGRSAKKRANDAERQRKSRSSSEKCHDESVTETRLDKSRVDKSRVDNNTSAKAPKFDAIEFGRQYEKLNQDSWRLWVEKRKSMRKPISQSAAKQQIEKLVYHNLNDQNEIIMQSITNDYQGLFELKNQKSVQPASQPIQQGFLDKLKNRGSIDGNQ